jgi:hypothetical protein
MSTTEGPWLHGAAYGHTHARIETPEGVVVGTVAVMRRAGTDEHGMPQYLPWDEGMDNMVLILKAPRMHFALSKIAAMSPYSGELMEAIVLAQGAIDPMQEGAT